MRDYEELYRQNIPPTPKTLRKIKEAFGEGSKEKGWENWFWAAKCLCKYDIDTYDGRLVGNMVNEAIRLGLTYRRDPALYLEAVQILVTVSTRLEEYEDVVNYLASILDSEPGSPDRIYHDFVTAQMHTRDIRRMLKYPRRFLENLGHNDAGDSDTFRKQRRIFEDFLLQGAAYLSQNHGAPVDEGMLLDAANLYGCAQTRKWELFREAAEGKLVSLVEIENLRHQEEGEEDTSSVGEIPPEVENRIEELEQQLLHAQEVIAKMEEEIQKLRVKPEDLSGVLAEKDIALLTHIQGYLYKVTVVLHSFLGKTLPKCAADWWEECIKRKLSYDQLEKISDNRYSKLSDFDLVLLLRTLQYNLSAIKTRGGHYMRDMDSRRIDGMVNIRNRWSHVGSVFPSREVVKSDISAIADFLGQIGGSEADRKEIRKYMRSLT